METVPDSVLWLVPGAPLVLIKHSDEVFGVSLGEDEDPRLLRAGAVSLLQRLRSRRRSEPCHDVARIRHGGNGVKGGKVTLTWKLVAFIYGLKNMG